MCRSAPAPRWWNYADARRARLEAPFAFVMLCKPRHDPRSQVLPSFAVVKPRIFCDPAQIARVLIHLGLPTDPPEPSQPTLPDDTAVPTPIEDAVANMRVIEAD